MKVSVDSDRCRGHGVCVALCPAVFELNDDGYAQARNPEVQNENEEAAIDAVDACPEHAIVVG
ncbi:ferredoxin [Nocardia sp. NPDC005366]|uniref:ferredoxin n=1 Tax=Nocardia sp. NPDC005366 TaxID=3156878 RepID=UPI0033A41514